MDHSDIHSSSVKARWKLLWSQDTAKMIEQSVADDHVDPTQS